MAKKKSSAHAEKNYKPANRRNLDLDKPTSHGGWPEGDYHPEVRSQVYDYLDDMGLIESILTRILVEQDMLANVDISINGVPLNVEFAGDSRSRTQGLMYRSSLDKDTGMLFAFPEQDKRSFWMKDTSVPLSIAYIDVKNKIINIEDMEPYSEVGIKSVSPAMYALEMNGGWFGRNGIKPGDAVYGLQSLTCESHKVLKSLIRENYRQIHLVEALTPKEMIRDVIRAALGAGAIVLTGGAGGDTVVDIIFAVESAAEILATIDGIISSASEIARAIKAAMSTNISAGADAVYSAVRDVVKSIADTGEMGADLVEKMAEEITDLLNKLASSVSDWVATVLPDDAGLGGVLVREALQEVISKLGENVYDLLKSAFNSLPDIAQKYMGDPSAFAAFLDEIAVKLVQFIDAKLEGEEPEEETEAPEQPEEESSFVGDVAGTMGSAMTAATPMGGMSGMSVDIADTPAGGLMYEKAKEFIDGPFREMIPVATETLNKLITSFFGAVALAQILATWAEDQEEEVEKAEEEAGVEDETPKSNKKQAPATESYLRSYIKEMLCEGIEFRQVESPLEYGRSSNVKRIALCDNSVTEPAGKHDAYFAEIEKWRKFTKGGRRLKKPKLDEIIPGVSNVCIIGFLDYHKETKLENGTTFWYSDYMKNRSDMRGQGSASQLIEKFYDTIPQPGDYVNFGKMMQPQVGHLKDKMAEKYPEIKTKGAKYF